MSVIEGLQDEIKEQFGIIDILKAEISKVIVGQEYLIDRLIIGILANGHVLVEGLPGLAKTLTVKTLSESLNLSFSRLQFTPDLLPADLIGTQIYNPREANFSVKKGPVFANIILADEINRAPAKVQSALLEAMQERQVTIGGETFPLPHPFIVIATENPIEQEGTYPLPEAQVDRFMFKLNVEYPSFEEERLILDSMAVTDKKTDISPVVNVEQILKMRQLVDQVYVDEKIKDYILRIVFATRTPEKYGISIGQYLRYGASPRATISLAIAAQAHAFLERRSYVTPQDIKSIAYDVLRHRLIVSYEAEAEELTTDNLITKILNELPVP